MTSTFKKNRNLRFLLVPMMIISKKVLTFNSYPVLSLFKIMRFNHYIFREKYRDFMEIIDKISLMNDLADNFTSRIDGVSSDITTLNSNIQNKVTKRVNEKLRYKILDLRCIFGTFLAHSALFYNRNNEFYLLKIMF